MPNSYNLSAGSLETATKHNPELKHILQDVLNWQGNLTNLSGIDPISPANIRGNNSLSPPPIVQNLSVVGGDGLFSIDITPPKNTIGILYYLVESSDTLPFETSQTIESYGPSPSTHFEVNENGVTKSWRVRAKFTSSDYGSPFLVKNIYSGIPTFLGLIIDGSATVSATPTANPFIAYGSFLLDYTTSRNDAAEFAAMFKMHVTLQGGDKVALFSGVEQLSGGGPSWAMNLVAQSDSGVGDFGLAGIEIDVNNNNEEMSSIFNPYTIAVLCTGGGSFISTSAIYISGIGQIWERGLYFDINDSIRTSSIEDECYSINAYLLSGTHDFGIKAGGAAIGVSVLQTPNNKPISSLDNAAVNRDTLKLDNNNQLILGYSGMSGMFCDGWRDFLEISTPSAPSSNKMRMWVEDNGFGKTRFMIQFSSGSAIQLAIQP